MEFECNKTVLGRGGFGIIFNGFLGPNRKPVAVKRLMLEDVDGSEKEEEALRNLKHPNVVELHHVKSDSSFRRMPPREEVLYQLATGLEYIHKRGMVHRDIKPENVLIWVNPEKEEEVLMKWADFGLSKRVNERGSFSTSGVQGTDNWLAPELLKILIQEDELMDGTEGTSSRQRGTVKSDVYAEGLVFGYFYLDGEHIFGNIHSQTDIANNILKNNTVNISKIQPTHVHDLIVKMLSSVPDKRITSSEVVEFLTEYRTQHVRNQFRKGYIEKAGYGILFEGVWGTTRLPVAIKRMQSIHVLGQKQEESWLGLNHDNVVKLFHAENDSKFRYYALELCQASLNQIFLKDGDPQKYRGPKPQTEEALYQLAMGLEYIHEKKLIHCDLKPKNVLLWTGNSSTVMKWTNFGSSKEIDAKGTCPINEIKGGLDWLAPEILKALENEENQSENLAQLLWECCTFKSDVFAEGLVFGFLLLGGLHPYGSVSRNIQTNINQDKPASMSTKIPTSPIGELTLKMLAYKQENRLTASEIVEEFGDIRKVEINCIHDYGHNASLPVLCRNYGYENLYIIKLLIENGIEVHCNPNNEGNALNIIINHYREENRANIVELLSKEEIRQRGRTQAGSSSKAMKRKHN
ncbi:hypothetical protein DAPPUDRAFT_229351 [Daphnia pulex]|uniref:Protein kinase domain-containing protein n=1 Tax=Daphnia pulex TaxID=6669 RepID=E9HNG5_DAPPU|nr:hypothetical protein DAPPUDRAFT_229351 [Daphnia pulex]|eukprot:EFX66662.1 hypothetical protein DAPPUDRAFT_229351 [Daphnia pulex]